MGFVKSGFVTSGYVGADTFLSDRVKVANQGECLLELYLLDLNGDEEIIRVSRHGTSTKTKNVQIGSNSEDVLLANKTYYRRLLSYPEIRESAWDGNNLFGSITTPNTHTFRIKNTNGTYDYLEDYAWEGRVYKAFFVDRQNPGDGIKLCSGILSPPEFTTQEIIVNGRSLEHILSTPITKHRFRGTGYGLELNGDKIVSFGNPSQVQTRQSMCAEGWIWLESYATTDPRRAWGHWSSGAATIGPWQWCPLSNGTVSVRCSIGGVEESEESTYVIPLKTPVHCGFVINGRDLTFIFYNQDTNERIIEEHVNAFSNSTRDAPHAASNYVLRTATDATLKLWYDDLRVWNYARSIADIDNWRFRPLITPQTGLVHYVKLDEGTGTSVQDFSTTAANGTISGAGTHTWIWQCEGGVELAGVDKQEIWGKRFGIAPTLVDPVRYIYSVGPGPYESIEVYEGGLLVVQNADAGSLRSLVTGSVAGGTNTPLLSRGLFRLGTKPQKTISCIVEGYNDGVGGAGGYVETISEVSRKIAGDKVLELTDPDDFEVTSFVDLLGIDDSVIGISSYELGGSNKGSGSGSTPEGESDDNTDNNKTVARALGALLQSTGGRVGFRPNDDKLFVERFGGPSGDIDWVISHFLRPPTKIPPGKIIYGVKILYHRNDTVMSIADLSQTLIGTDQWYQWTVPYLEELSEDLELKELYQGKGGGLFTISTCLYNGDDAKRLADRILPIVKGKKYTHEILVPEIYSGVKVGDTIALDYRLPDKTPRLKMDGTRGLWVLQKEQNRMTGSILIRAWGE